MSSFGDRMVRDMQLRRFSKSTQETYLREVEHLAQHLHQPLDNVNPAQLQDYILFLLTERKLAWSTVNVITAALRFFYRVTLNRRDLVLTIPRRKNPQHLPEILNGPELGRLFDLDNPKHRVLLMTTYAAGLRVSEVVRLKVTDIDSHRMMIRVNDGKGEKDRYTILSQRLLPELRAYWKIHRPSQWLFPGQKPGQPLGPRTAEAVFKEAKIERRYPSPVEFTCCVTALPPIYWKLGWTCAPSKCCWAIPLSFPHLATYNSPVRPWIPSRALWIYWICQKLLGAGKTRNVADSYLKGGSGGQQPAVTVGSSRHLSGVRPSLPASPSLTPFPPQGDARH